VKEEGDEAPGDERDKMDVSGERKDTSVSRGEPAETST